MKKIKDGVIHPDLPFLVDCFRRNGYDKVFLTHFHAGRFGLISFANFQVDHYQGLNAYGHKYEIYCTKETRDLIDLYFEGNFKGKIHIIESGNSKSVEVIGKDGRKLYVTVSAIESNHCFGSVMFLFQTSRGLKILHTGDFRFENINHFEMPVSIPKLDKIIFDSTFTSKHFTRIASRKLALDKLINFIKKNVNTRGKDFSESRRVYLCADILGTEYAFMRLAKEFGCKIGVLCFHKKFISKKRYKQLRFFSKDVNGLGKYLCFEDDNPSGFEKDTFIRLISRIRMNFLIKKNTRVLSNSENQRASHGNSVLVKTRSNYTPLFVQLACIGSVMFGYQQEKRYDRILGEGTIRELNGVHRVVFSAHSSLEELMEFVCHLEDRGMLEIRNNRRDIIKLFEMVDNPVDMSKHMNQNDYGRVRKRKEDTPFRLIMERRKYVQRRGHREGNVDEFNFSKNYYPLDDDDIPYVPFEGGSQEDMFSELDDSLSSDENGNYCGKRKREYQPFDATEKPMKKQKIDHFYH